MALRLNTSEKNEIMPRRKARAEKPRLAQMLLRSGSLAGAESTTSGPSLGVGGVGSLRLRPLFVPSIAVPSQPPRLLWIKSIYRPLAPLPSLSLTPPMMTRTHAFMAMLARLARRVRH